MRPAHNQRALTIKQHASTAISTNTPVVRFLHKTWPTGGASVWFETIPEMSVAHRGDATNAAQIAASATTQKKTRQHTPQQHLEKCFKRPGGSHAPRMQQSMRLTHFCQHAACIHSIICTYIHMRMRAAAMTSAGREQDW